MNDFGFDRLTEIPSVLDNMREPIFLSVATVSISLSMRFTRTAKFSSMKRDQLIDKTPFSISS